MTRLESALQRGQWAAWILLPILVAHSWFAVALVAPTTYPIILELHGVVFKLVDIAPLILLGITGARLLISPAYRQHLRETLRTLMAIPFNRGWPLLIGWMFVGVLWSPVPQLTLYQSVYTAMMIICSVIACDLIDRQQIPAFVLRWLSLAVCAQAALCIVQGVNGGALGFTWLGEAQYAGVRAQGLTYNPNTVGNYLSISLFGVILALWQGTQQVRRNQMRQNTLLRVLGITALAAIVGGLIATQSRTSFIAAGVGIGMLLWTARQNRFIRHLVIPVTAVGALIFLVMLVLSSPLLSRFNLNEETTSRLTFGFQGTLAVLQRSQPLTGVGAGGLMVIVDQLVARGEVNFRDVVSDRFLQPAHNAYLTLLAELGVVGFVCFITGLVPLIGGLRQQASFPVSIVSCGVLAMLIVMLTEFHFWLDPHWRMFLFWWLGLWWGLKLNSSAMAVAKT